MKSKQLLFSLVVLLSLNYFSLSAQNQFPTTAGSHVEIDGGYIKLFRPETLSSWARGLFFYNDKTDDEWAGIGLYGTGESVNSIYLGYGNDPFWNDNGVHLLPNGSTGIGTRNPQEKLHLNSDLATHFLITGQQAKSYYRINNEDINLLLGSYTKTLSAGYTLYDNYLKGSAVLSLSGTDVERLLIGVNADAPLILGTNNSERFRITGSGNVGIGVNNPSQKLEVVGDILVKGNRDILLDGNSGSIEYHTPSAGGWTMGQKFMNQANEYLGGWRAFGDPTALHYYYVGIDYTNPLFKIKSDGNAALRGKFEAKEIKVQSAPTADFVFNDNYDLKGIDEVEKFIKENKHLPDFPSGKEIEENGVNLGEMDAKLLQKIEELMLYTIEQENRIEKLEEIIKKLQ